MKAKYNKLRAIVALSALALGFGTASADGPGFCSAANGAGRWGFTLTGTNTSGAPDASVGSGTVSPWGDVKLKQTEVSNGAATVGELNGRVTVNRNCTATLTATLSIDGTPIVTSTWALVYVDNQNEIRGILTALDKMPEGGALPVQTLNAKKLSVVAPH